MTRPPGPPAADRRGRGRPRKAEALTNAQRQAAWRARQRAAKAAQQVVTVMEHPLAAQCKWLREETRSRAAGARSTRSAVPDARFTGPGHAGGGCRRASLVNSCEFRFLSQDLRGFAQSITGVRCRFMYAFGATECLLECSWSTGSCVFARTQRSWCLYLLRLFGHALAAQAANHQPFLTVSEG